MKINTKKLENNYPLIYFLLNIGIVAESFILFNLLFVLFLKHQELILSLFLSLMFYFIYSLLISYDDEYSPVPSIGMILTIPEKEVTKNIVNFLKKEFNDCEIDLTSRKELVRHLTHEKIHRKLSKPFKIRTSIHLKCEKYQEKEKSVIMPTLWCNLYFPNMEHFNKFFPRFFLVISIQIIFDFIWDLSRGTFFTNFHMRILDNSTILRARHTKVII